VIHLLDESKLALAASAKGVVVKRTVFQLSSYAIIWIDGSNEIPSGNESAVQLRSTNQGFSFSNMDECDLSKAEVAPVCVQALLDPNASTRPR
jgi:hypothetical protein